jgi:hypothetical protein
MNPLDAFAGDIFAPETLEYEVRVSFIRYSPGPGDTDRFYDFGLFEIKTELVFG